MISLVQNIIALFRRCFPGMHGLFCCETLSQKVPLHVKKTDLKLEHSRVRPLMDRGGNANKERTGRSTRNKGSIDQPEKCWIMID